MQLSNLLYKLQDIPISKIDVWEEAQARKLDTEGIKELAKSIESEGLQSPPLVKKDGPRYKLFAGQRRLAAIKYLKKTTIPCLVLSKNITIEDAKAASLIENIHRKGMENKDISTSINYLLETIKSKSKVAKMLGMSDRTLRRYLGFGSLPGQIKELVPDKISRDEAVKIFRIIPKIKKVIEIINKISKFEKTIRIKYVQELAKGPSTTHDIILKKIKNENYKKLDIKLTKKQIKFVAKHAKKLKKKPEDMIKILVQIGILNFKNLIK